MRNPVDPSESVSGKTVVLDIKLKMNDNLHTDIGEAKPEILRYLQKDT